MSFTKDFSEAKSAPLQVISTHTNNQEDTPAFFAIACQKLTVTVPENDSAFFKTEPTVSRLLPAAKTNATDFFESFKEITQEQKQEILHRIGKLKYDKTIAQIELKAQEKQLEESRPHSIELLSKVKDSKQVIATCDEKIALAKVQISTFETALRKLSLSLCTSKKDTENNNAAEFKKQIGNEILASKNNSGFWKTNTVLEKVQALHSNETSPFLCR